jgi:hypothetical protein
VELSKKARPENGLAAAAEYFRKDPWFRFVCAKCPQSVRCGRATKVIKKQTQIIGIIIVVVHWQARDIDAKQDTHIF